MERVWGQSSHLGSPSRGRMCECRGSRREETRIWTRTSRRRARVGKSRDGFPSSSSGPDKFEGSDLDGAGESGDGDDESVELDPK